MKFTEEEITQIYVATFNRAPDAAGLNYWMNESAFENIEDVAESFFDSAEAQDIYSNANTSAEMVQSAYQNLFGRNADSEGLDYWTNQLDSGSFSQSLMLQALINGAVDEDALLIQNKTTVGIDYANRGINNADTALSIMQNVTYDEASVEDAYTYMSSMGFERIYDFSNEMDTGFEDFEIDNFSNENEIDIEIENFNNVNHDNLGGFTGGSFGGMMAYEYNDLDTQINASIDINLVGVEDTTTTATVDTIA